MTNLELRKFYVSLRDKHLSQLMDISGKVAFTALSIIVGILFALEDLKKIELVGFWGWILTGAGVLGIILLGWATIIFSRFHTDQIRYFESELKNGSPSDGEKTFNVLPSSLPNYFIFWGIVALLVSAIGLAVMYARQQ
jgi:hypothetical protein